MRPSRIVLLLVALLAGGLAAYLATRGDAPVQQAEQQPVEVPKTQILVATAPIGVGQRLSATSVEWANWPVDEIRPEYINIASVPDAIEKMDGTVARFEIFAGEPIREQKLVRAEQGYLSAVLDKGKRGVSIAVTASSASGGFIVPNDHVDVILTHSGNDGSQVSETVLENVKVLAIGTRLGETGTTGAPSDPENPRAEIFADQTIATLELDPSQGETIVNAAATGPLSLALRSIVDFNQPRGSTPQRASNQAVRMIRFGRDTNVTPGTALTATATDIGDAPVQVSAPPILAPTTPAPAAQPAGPAPAEAVQ